MFYSDAKQDRFVANMYKFKKTGFYLDIGSADSKLNNNTYFFSQLGWKGICIEFDSHYQKGYFDRKNCIFYCGDATKLDYSSILNSAGCGNMIDYISLDVDELTTSVLKMLPLNELKFGVLTIEHDFYRFGSKYQSIQRQFLLGKKYKLLCSNVCVQQPDFESERSSFEDWWVNPDIFAQETLNKLESDFLYPSQIIEKFNNTQNWWY